MVIVQASIYVASEPCMILCSNGDRVKLPEMVSHVVSEGCCYEWPLYVRESRIQSVWSPTVGEILRLTTELTNSHNPFAVAVLKDGYKVGHIPRTASQPASFLLSYRKDDSVSFCVNRGPGYGLEIPCVYQFYGCLAYIERLKNLVL